MYVVTGVTGKTGGVVAQELLAAGLPVRAVVRDAAKGAEWAARGAEVAVADLFDEDALVAALTGATAAWLLLPPDMGADDYLGSRRVLSATLRRAVQRADVPRVVLLSSRGAQLPDTGVIRSVTHLEQVFADRPGVTALRPDYFAENLAGSLGALADGVLPTFIAADHPVGLVATADVGRVAATLLRQAPDAAPRVVELTGPRDLTAHDLAAHLSAVLGREIRALDLPLDAVVPTLTGFGISTDVARLYEGLYAAIAEDRLGFEDPAGVVRGRVDGLEVLDGLLAGA